MKVSMWSMWRTVEAGFACCSKWVSWALYFWSLTAIWRTTTVVPRNDVPKLTACWRRDTRVDLFAPSYKSISRGVHPTHAAWFQRHPCWGPVRTVCKWGDTLFPFGSWFIPRQGLVPIDRLVNALTRKVFLMNCGHRNQHIKARTENKLSLGDIKKDPKCWDNSHSISIVYRQAV